jgi:hypothetical protein
LSIKRLALDPRKNVRLPLAQQGAFIQRQKHPLPQPDKGFSIARWLAGGQLFGS